MFSKVKFNKEFNYGISTTFILIIDFEISFLKLTKIRGGLQYQALCSSWDKFLTHYQTSIIFLSKLQLNQALNMSIKKKLCLGKKVKGDNDGLCVTYFKQNEAFQQILIKTCYNYQWGWKKIKREYYRSLVQNILYSSKRTLALQRCI